MTNQDQAAADEYACDIAKPVIRSMMPMMSRGEFAAHLKNAVLHGITRERARAENLVNALDKVQAHGLHHYDDCSNREYDDQNCNCGMEKTEIIVRDSIAKYRANEGEK